MILQPGDILLDKYRIERLLGQGAFAQVYLATHLQLRAPRALKVLRRDAPGLGSTEFHDYRQRFELEAQLGAALDHPHVIRVYDFEQEGEALILVMEYAAGGSLAERIAAARKEGRPLPVDECVRIAREVAEGLAVLHGRDIVHRDLKPSNVLFDGEGRAKVADLGLAQTKDDLTKRELLGSQARPQPGTPDYMSPEQVANAPRLAPPSDVYALGAVLFEMLTGRLYRNVRPGTRVRELRPEVPEWLDALVARMVAEEPGARPWDGAEVARLLKELVFYNVSKISGLWTVDTTGFPMIFVEPLALWMQMFPVTIYQYKMFASRFKDTAQVLSDQLDPLQATNGLFKTNIPSKRDLKTYLALGVSFDEAQNYAAWCGTAYMIPEVRLWRGAYLWMKDKPSCLRPENWDDLSRLAQEVWQQIWRISSPATLLDQSLMSEGILEWVFDTESIPPRPGGMGKPLREIWQVLRAPMDNPVHPLSDISAFGIRLFRRVE